MLFLLKVGGEAYNYTMIIGTYYYFCLLAGPIIIMLTIHFTDVYYVVSIILQGLGRRVARHVQKEVSSVHGINNVQKLGKSC